jgi:hypothetical protein
LCVRHFCMSTIFHVPAILLFESDVYQPFYPV